jgi:nitrogenase molybdenum-iron protein alpha chain
MMKDAFGTNWLKVNFIGLGAVASTLRGIATFFGDCGLSERTEEVLDEEMRAISGDVAYYRERLSGKKAAIFVGGSRSHHYQDLLSDFGIQTVLAGYEFAHRDDYEGRRVIPDIKEDADSKNIENLVVDKDLRYRAFLSPERAIELKEKIGLENYDGLIKDMQDGTFVVDDLNHYETEAFIELLKPDIFFSGIKDKYVVQKGGVLSRQLHSYDYSGPYSGFKGALVFGRDLSMGLYAPAWKLVSPPWAKNKGPAARTGLKEEGDAA